jgi:aminoglycoside N3'-acetyltransferase
MTQPIEIGRLIDCLKELGVKQGDSILTHTAFRSLFHGGDQPVDAGYFWSRSYGRDLIRALKDLTGDDGVLMMPTEFLPDYQMAAFRADLYDTRTAPTNRGFLCDLFMEFPQVIRSCHPIYNVTSLGSDFTPFIDAHPSLEYSMDVGSPWWEFMQRGGKIIFLGASLDSNSFIHMPEYVLKDAYPRPVFFNRPHRFHVIDRNGQTIAVDGRVHAIRWGPMVVTKACHYLNQKYGILRQQSLGETLISVIDARAQYEALLREIELGFSWYDAMTWS